MNIQTFLVIGSLAALTYTSLNINNKISTQTTWELNNEAMFSGTGIGQSLLEEIELKAFDERTISSRINTTDSLTTTAALGIESGESILTTFDDFDDYNGYIKRDTLNRLGVFSAEIEVYYVNTMSPDVRSESRTFSKRVNVYVSNKYLLDTLVFVKIASY